MHEGGQLKGIGYHGASQTDLIVIQMDNFDVILGIEFLVEKGVIPIPSTRNLLIIGEKPTMMLVRMKQPPKVKLLLVLQLKKCVKRHKLT